MQAAILKLEDVRNCWWRAFVFMIFWILKKMLGRASGMVLLKNSSHSNIFRLNFRSQCSLMHFATRIVLLEPCFKSKKDTLNPS